MRMRKTMKWRKANSDTPTENNSIIKADLLRRELSTRCSSSGEADCSESAESPPKKTFTWESHSGAHRVMGSNACSRTSWQFLLLLWKNFKLQFRRPIGTFCELLLPILAVVFVIALKFALSITNEDRCFVTFESDQLVIPGTYPTVLPSSNGTSTVFNIFYSPQDENTSAIMAAFRRQIYSEPPLSPFNITGFDNETVMVAELERLVETTESNFCYKSGAGIIFDSLNGNNLQYTIRLRHEVGLQNSWRTIQASPNFELPGPRIANDYLSEGFLHLQKLVGEAIVEWKTVQASLPYQPVNVSIREFPYPEYSIDLFLSSVGTFLPLLFVMAFLYTAGTIVKELVLEKESRIRESMLMMGLKQWILWSSWFVKQFIFLMITILVISILLRFAVFPNSDFFLILIFFILVSISLISFCFLVSVWFDSARVGLIVGFVAWFANFFPILFLQARFSTLSLGAKVGASLLSNTALGFGVEVIARLEQRNSGLRWDNVAEPIAADDPFNMGWVFGMLLIDSFLYMVVAWYVNEVKPGQYGVPKPFYFPFLPSYWCSLPRGLVKKKESKIIERGLQEDPSAHEEITGNPEVGISIRHLTKIYSQLFTRKAARRKAVENLNLDMYKGQITALLGHNGAGKTTTMSILTGLYTPTEGTAMINGYSILTDMDLIRNSLGICPQHNVLFDRLTVREHLSFFMRLKGIHNRTQIKREVDQMIEDLLLSDKGDIQSSRLSGGMKRKLSVGIALIGGSEVVILDEPTSGMDPYARRATWDLLTKYKQNRCMLLTTHFMDEADLLGDRIAIMAEGKLRCSGSSLFLKSRYGVGYHMTVVKEDNCVSMEVERLVKSFVPTAEQVTDVGAELSFILPSNTAAKFPDLFDQLDARKVSLGVASFGISITTMEEVFIKVGEGTDECLEDRLKRGRSMRSRTMSPPTPIGQTKSPPKSPSTIDNRTDTFLNPMTVEDIDVEKTDNGDMWTSPDKNMEPRNPTEEPKPADEPKLISEPTDEPTVVVKGQNGPESYEPGPDSTPVALEKLSYQFYPNRYVLLWLQQFRAMFLKKFYTSIRFYPALLTQFVLPVIFVIFGLLVVITNPDQENDPPRALLLNNSGLDGRNTTLFFAELEGTAGLSNFSAGDLFVTAYLDISTPVTALKDSVDAIDNPDLCCNYQYQLLDKYCGSLPANMLASCANKNESFGYRRCMTEMNERKSCLTCCRATDISMSALRSCSNPYSIWQGAPSNDLFCPSPPSLSIYADSSGSLDTLNTYVAEHLLRTSTSAPDIDVVTFFRRYQAGFTVTAPDPVVSVCDNSRENGASDLGLTAFSLYRTFSCNQSDPVAVPDQMCLAYTNPDLSNCTLNYNLTSRTRSCYSADPFLTATLQLCTCGSEMCASAIPSANMGPGINPTVDPNTMGETIDNPFNLLPDEDRVISKVYPEQLESPPTVTVWYNNAPFHMAAAALNAFQSMRLKNLMGNKDFSLTVVNHPLPRNDTSLIQATALDFTGFGLSVLVIFGYSFLLANFVLFLVKEKESKAKHLQFVSGVNPISYWLSTFTWDMLNSLLPIILTIIIFRAFPEESYHGAALGAIFLVLVLTCWAGIPLTYIFSFFFSNSLAAFSVLVLIFFFVSLILLTIVFLVQVFEGTRTADILHYIFLLTPTYGLSTALNDIYRNQQFKTTCQGRESLCAMQNIIYVDNPITFSRPGIGVICLYLFLQGVIFFTITLLLEYKLFIPKLKGCFLHGGKRVPAHRAEEPLLPGEDADVYAERKRVSFSGSSDGDAVIIKGLVKVYSSHLSGCSVRPPKTAVAGISLGIPSGECFGLLGVNGAGKTTTFSILTGDIGMTSGTAVIAGYDIRSDLSAVQQRVGYCPQFDALIERMTGRELLWMFARLRGVPEKQIKDVVDTEIRRLDLKKYANKRCGTYSGGNKRKLSTAIAMVGNPPIVMLDEPTTGMDPNTRRYLWDVLTNVTREGRSIILTSHSMEECEALCTRLAIMVNGQFKCLGSIQHLKNKFGSGFTLQAKVKLVPSENIQEDLVFKPKRSSIRRQDSGRGSTRGGSSHGSSRTKQLSEASQPSSSPFKDSAVGRGPSQASSVPLGGGQMASVFNPYDTTSLHIFIRDSFSGAVLMEEHQGSVTYQLPSAGVTWSSVFRLLESNKERLGIIDYSVSQTTLEQVFINFAKEQEEETV